MDSLSAETSGKIELLSLAFDFFFLIRFLLAIMRRYSENKPGPLTCTLNFSKPAQQCIPIEIVKI